MIRSLAVGLGAALIACAAADARAQGRRMTIDDAMAIARARAPEVLIEEARVAEAEARRQGASLLLRENPELELGAGRRWRSAADPAGPALELEASVTQMIELGGKRGARVAEAEAGLERARDGAADAVRRAQLAVAIRFHRAVHARERVRLARAGADAAEAAARAALHRGRRGDATDLEVDLARAAGARARAQVLVAEADQRSLVAELGTELGLDRGEPLELVGELGPAPVAPLDQLLARARRRPDLRALAGEEREGRAEADLGAAMRWPDLGLRATYAREGDERIWLGGLVIRLPLFERGQEASAAGRARAARAGIERGALSRRIEREIRAAHARVAALAAAVHTLEADAMPLIADGERLLARSLETGLIGLGDYLAARRELADARADHLDRLLDLAIARSELALAAGELR